MVSIQTVITAGMKKGIVLLIALIIFAVSAFVAYSQTSAVCPIAAYEGSVVTLHPEAYDPDKDIGPAGKLIWAVSSPFNNSGMWQTVKGQRGVYDFWISVSDGELKDTVNSCVEVLPNNRNPVLAPLKDVYINRGDNVQIQASCYDSDGDAVSISYRFNGKDVAYIIYEPPGVYGLEVICEDGYGGMDTKRAKLHIAMQEEKKTKKSAPVIVAQQVTTKTKPTEVELVLLKKGNDTIEVNYPASKCAPCPSKDTFDVVIYDSAYPLQGDTNTTGHFVLEGKSAPVNKTSKPAVKIVSKSDSCAEGLKRKAAISKAMGCC